MHQNLQLSKLESTQADKLREKISFYQEIPGLEWLAGLFDLPRASLLDYIPKNSIIFLDEHSLEQEIKYIKEETEKLHQEAERKEEVAPSPATLLENSEVLSQKINDYQVFISII